MIVSTELSSNPVLSEKPEIKLTFFKSDAFYLANLIISLLGSMPMTLLLTSLQIVVEMPVPHPKSTITDGLFPKYLSSISLTFSGHLGRALS